MLGESNDLPHGKDLTCVIDRMCFDEHYTKSCRDCAVQIDHARFLYPDERVITARACRTPNYLAQAVDPKNTAPISPVEHSDFHHSSRLPPKKSAQTTSALPVSTH